MRNFIVLSFLLTVACGGGEKAEAPPAEPAAAEAPPAAETAPAAAPAAEAAPDLAAMPEADRTAWLMKRGQEVYAQGATGGIACTTCHQADGNGVPAAFPPLAGQKDHMGDCVKHAGIVINGLNGEITVNGQKYNGAMPAQGAMSDADIAAVITYERQSFGNSFGPCLPADVAKARTLPAPVLK